MLQPAPPIPPRPGKKDEHCGIQLTNVKEGETVHQRFLLVHGNATLRGETAVNVHCHDYVTTTWPCVEGHFKALVHLVPGPNTIRITINTLSTILHVNYLPLLQNPPVFLCIFVASDSPLVFDVPPEKRQENGLAVAIEKLRMAGYLWQAFCAEQMYRNGQGRRTFRLDETWLPDTTSPDHAMRQTAQVHIIRSKHNLKEIRDLRRAQQSPGRDDGVPSLFSFFLDDLNNHPRFKQPCIVSGLILDSHWDVKKQVVLGHAALGGGGGDHALGIFGSHLLHAWPRHIHEIVPCMLNTTRTDTRYVANDANESGEWWRALNIGMGAMLHELGHAFSLTHTASGIMSRGFNNWNRTFMAKEPGLQPIRPEDEAGSHWHRVDIVRLRFHPAFRLPSDVHPTHDESSPSFVPLGHDQIELRAPAGLSMLEMIVNGKYRHHLEYLGDIQPPRLLLSLKHIQQQCCIQPGERLRLEATSINQKTESIDDVRQFLESHIVHLPGIDGPVIKSHGYGQRGLNGSPSTVVLANKPLRNIRVYHGAALDGLVFQWADGSEAALGGRGGGTTDFALHPGEQIVGLTIRSGAWVDGVQFKTSTGRRSPWFGGSGGGLHYADPPQGYVLVGLYGSAAAWMDQLGIFYKKG